MTQTKNHGVETGTKPAPETYSVEIQKDGPYLVKGFQELRQMEISTNSTGNSWEYKNKKNLPLNPKGTALCRCGKSNKKPSCDGSHASASVDLAETASFEPLLKNAVLVEGPELSLTDNEKYCAYARFCDNGMRVWEEVQHAGATHQQLTKHMAHHCPGGRLLAWDNQTRQPIEEPTPQSIQILEDSALGVSGPLAVWGGVKVKSANGSSYEVRTRQALCRCGESSNKPFCDGTHASMKFQDNV